MVPKLEHLAGVIAKLEGMAPELEATPVECLYSLAMLACRARGCAIIASRGELATVPAAMAIAVRGNALADRLGAYADRYPVDRVGTLPALPRRERFDPPRSNRRIDFGDD